MSIIIVIISIIFIPGVFLTAFSLRESLVGLIQAPPYSIWSPQCVLKQNRAGRRGFYGVIHFGSKQNSGQTQTIVTPVSGHQRKLWLSRMVIHKGLWGKDRQSLQAVWCTVSWWPTECCHCQVLLGPYNRAIFQVSSLPSDDHSALRF